MRPGFVTHPIGCASGEPALQISQAAEALRSSDKLSPSPIGSEKKKEVLTTIKSSRSEAQESHNEEKKKGRHNKVCPSAVALFRLHRLCLTERAIFGAVEAESCAADRHIATESRKKREAWKRQLVSITQFLFFPPCLPSDKGEP